MNKKQLTKAIKEAANVYLYVRLTDEDAHNVLVSKTTAKKALEVFNGNEEINASASGKNVYIG